MSFDFGLGKKLKQQVSENPVWQKAADVPDSRSTCVAINDRLFAVIYCYHPLDDSWQIAGRMPTAHSMCIAA